MLGPCGDGDTAPAMKYDSQIFGSGTLPKDAQLFIEFKLIHDGGDGGGVGGGVGQDGRHADHPPEDDGQHVSCFLFHFPHLHGFETDVPHAAPLGLAGSQVGVVVIEFNI